MNFHFFTLFLGFLFLLNYLIMCYSFFFPFFYIELHNLVLLIFYVKLVWFHTLVFRVVNYKCTPCSVRTILFCNLLLLLVSLPYDLLSSTELSYCFLLGSTFKLHPWMANYIRHAQSILRINMEHASDELLEFLRKRSL